MAEPGLAFEEGLVALAGELLGGQLPLHEVHRRVLERAVRAVPHVVAGAVLVRQPDGRYHYSATLGYDPDDLNTFTFGAHELLYDPARPSQVYGDVLAHLAAVLDPARLGAVRRGWRHAAWRSTLAVPFSPEAQPAAILYLHSGCAPEELARSARPAELFGAQVALAVQRATLGEEVRRSRQELALLDRSRDVIVRAANQAELFGGLVGIVRDVMGYEHVHIGLLEGGELVVQPPVGSPALPRFPVNRGVVGHVAATGEALLVPDVRAEPRYVAFFPEVVSELCVPLSDGDTRVGVLNIETGARALTGDDLRLMVTLSGWLGRAIERERLYQRAARQRCELDLLHRVRTALGREIEVRGVIRAVNEALAQLLGYTHVSVYLRRGDHLELQHQLGYPRVLGRVGLESGVMGRVARTGEAVWLEDLADDPHSLRACEGIRSEVCVPLRRGGEVVGVLNVETVGERQLSRDDWRLIEAVGEYVGYALDRAHLHEQVQEREALYRLLAEHTSDLVCLHHPDGTFAYVSPSVRTLLGYDPAALLGTHPRPLIHPADLHLLARFSVPEQLPAGPSAPLRVRLRRAGGGFVWFETGVSAVRGPGGVTHFLTSSRDITQRQAIEAQLAQAASHDPLTGLPNRRELLAALERAVRGARGRGEAGYTVLYLDMDRFKVVNDSLGHSVGDELLVAFADRLRGAMPGRLVARLGGDEFAVLFTGRSSFEDARGAAARLHAALAAPFAVSGHGLRVSVSVGIAPGRPGYLSAAEVLRDADLSMYRAKRARHLPYAVFEPAMHEGAVRQLRLEADLPGAVASGAIHLAYQPIVELASGRIRGFEALARWTHPVLGPVPPGEFIALAEELGLIVNLGLAVLRRACAWRAALPGGDCGIHVNVSPRQFLLDSFADDVRAVLEETGTPPGALHLEVTETTFVEDREGAARILGRLRDLGVRVHIDDFGTGHSSLGFLHRFPVDALKIDRSFVTGLGEDRASSGVVETVLALARTLGIETVAEGIETEAQRLHLLYLGGTLGQGYLFSRPLPEEAAREAWITSSARTACLIPGPGSGRRDLS
ncbi:diguanylate cyclase/phosphodiesterase [Deinococcus aerius]|uniref:Diguanylate cyclase/phosphodiesterase n=1 Tax=Deinococcus aerius TaxID=200253 RepID=A0A2I9DBU6_9DEIO|nr:EAL domain-containing protein [Deinococcus aerius]GBF08160.1 diguanylate cyclase/phosphodiesterase [Deinococcus aerius]